ncbi:MAG: hypothetical protein AAF802_07690 [Planctomycetota bacterium]
MPVNEEERSLRRRIVFRAMQGKAPENAIQNAIDTLDTEFANVEHLRFNELIRRLQETLDSVEVNLGLVLSDIMKLRSMPASEIGPDPGPSNKPIQTNPSKPASVKVEGEHKVFSRMMETVIAQLRHRRDGSETLLIQSLRQAPEIKALSSRIVEPLSSWTKESQPGSLAFNGSVDEYRIVIHSAYIWLCEKLGPVEADRALKGAVRVTEQLPEAVASPPQQLL